MILSKIKFSIMSKTSNRGGKKIMIVSDSFPPVPSGVSKYAYMMAEKLLINNHKVIVITGNVQKKVSEDEKIRELGGSVIRLGKLISVYANGTRCFITLLGPKDFISMMSLFNSFSPDTVVLQGPLGLTLPYPATLFSKSSKKIGIFHSSTDKPNLAFILFKPFMKPFLNALDVRIAVSNRAREEIEKYFGKQDFHIIPPGVDTRFYNHRVADKSSDKIVFFFLGRLDERKGVDVLLRVWKKIRRFAIKNKREVPVKLLIGGDGPMRNLVQKESAFLKDVEYLGFVDENVLPKIYASSDVSIFPSKGGESFGIVLIESMACGTPPLASNIAGYRDVVKNEYNGLLFSSEFDLHRKIEILSTDENLRNQLSKNALFSSKNYDWDKIIEEIQKLL